MSVSSASRLANSAFAVALVSSLLWPSSYALAVGRGPRCLGEPMEEVTEDGSPTILGPSALAAAEVVDWWHRTKRPQPEPLTAPIDDVLTAYIDNGEAEGVRGDWALAQAILETGWFSSGDTPINNFAGIGHRQDREDGFSFPDADTGVRAHVQLLKRFAAGNDVELASAEAAPRARATATTWAELAGTWASSPEYWTDLVQVYQHLHRGVCMA